MLEALLQRVVGQQAAQAAHGARGAAPPPPNPLPEGRVPLSAVLQGLAPFSGKEGDDLESWLQQYESRMKAFNLRPEYGHILAKWEGAAGDWLALAVAVPDGSPAMTYEEVVALIRQNWSTKVRTTAAEARRTLHSGRHAMQAYERVVLYNQRFKRLHNLCPRMDMEDAILFYQNGLHTRLFQHCVVDVNGKDFTNLQSLMEWAVGQEQRLNAQNSARNKGSHLSLAAARVQGRGAVRSRDESTEDDADDADMMEQPTPNKKAKPTVAAAFTPGKKGSPPGKGKGSPQSGKGKGPQGKGSQQGKGKSKGSSRSERWKALCREHKLCARCGKSTHWVRDCPEPVDMPEPPAGPPDAPSTSGRH